VVDDNETNLNVASGLLRTCQITPDTTTSGRNAIEMVQQNSYDIVFMDHRMPGMNGSEVTSAIRQLGISVPIIALTASVVLDAREKMLASGMNDYLSKPIDKAELMRVLRRWLPAEKLLDLPTHSERASNVDDESHKEFWAKLEQIEGLDLTAGLGRADGQREVYKKTLKLMIREIEKSNANLPAFLASGDIDRFNIEVHGIKGVLANVGVMRVSTKAYVLEKASGKKEIDFCTSHLPVLLEELKNLHASLQEAFAVLVHGDDQMEMPPELPTIFANLIKAFDTIDLVEIDKEIVKLSALNLRGKLKDDVEKIEDSVMMMDYVGATEHIRKLLRKA
jgi:CheY-like chemotaxis protein/HPt (histidine-containing phosphotransfer) domain-containing protein